MNYLAIVPARGGSKGIINKNITLLNGRPLISYTLNAALASKHIDRLVISTDDSEIAKLGKSFGIDIPFLRPKKYSHDSSPSIDLVLHAIRWFSKNVNYNPDAIILLQPTSPFRTKNHIDNAIKLFTKTKPDTLVSVVELPHNFNPSKLVKIENNQIVSVYDDVDNFRILPRQELPKLYARNGPSILISKVSFLQKNKSFYGGKTIPYIMDFFDSIDIDDNSDLLMAELIFKNKQKNEKDI